MEDSFRMDVAPEGINFAWRDRSLLPLSTRDEWSMRGNGTEDPQRICSWLLDSPQGLLQLECGLEQPQVTSQARGYGNLLCPHFSGAQIWVPKVWGFEESIACVQPHKSTRLLDLRKLLMSICDGKWLLQSKDLLMQSCWGKQSELTKRVDWKWISKAT